MRSLARMIDLAQQCQRALRVLKDRTARIRGLTQHVVMPWHVSKCSGASIWDVMGVGPFRGFEMSRRYEGTQSTDENLLQLPEFMYAKRILVVVNPVEGKCGILALLAFRDDKPQAYRGSEEIETCRKLIAGVRKSLKASWLAVPCHCSAFSCRFVWYELPLYLHCRSMLINMINWANC